jgi:hypothetical protein
MTRTPFDGTDDRYNPLSGYISIKPDGTIKGIDQRKFGELKPTKISLFGNHERGWGVSVSRDGELSQTILPQRETVISDGSVPYLRESPVVTLHTFTLDQANRVYGWLGRMGTALDRKASGLRMLAVSIALQEV